MYRVLCKEGCLKETLHILHTCITKDALWDGKLIRCFIAARGFSIATRIVLQNKLINMYATCGSLVDCRQVFDHMTERDTSSWNMIIAALRKHGFSEETLALFHQMPRTGVQPDQFTFASILPVCARMGALEQGMEIHQSITRSGFSSDIIVGNALLDMYVKCRSLHKARKLFGTMPQRNVVSWTVMIAGHAQNGLLDEALRLFKEIPQQDVVSWTAMISGYAQNGLAEKALEKFKQMQLAGVKPNSATFVSILSACAKMGALEQGMDIHHSIRQSGFSTNVEVGNALIDMYVKCGSIQRAHKFFDTMPQRNVVSWTAMIAGCAQNGLFEMALETFKKMQLAGVKPDSATFASVLPACAKIGDLEQGIEFHQRVMKCGFLSNVVVGNALINMYAKCGSIQKARKLFDTMSQQDVVSCNGMIAGYAQNGHFEKALEIFQQMPQTGVQPDQLTFVNLLPACAKMECLEQGIDIHQSINRSGYLSDVVVGNALIDMYAKCRSTQRARELFDTMPQRDVVSWTRMIAGYAKNGVLEEAIQLLKEMPQQDVVSWNAIIAQYAEDGLVERALEIFKQMELAGVTPNAATFVSILSACTKTGALEQGMDIHQSIRKKGLCSNVVVGSSLIDMYAKCGNIQKARELFDTMPQQDVVSWTAMIAGYGMHGYGEDAIKLFELMKLSRTYPDHVSFVCVLFACSHVGLINKGCKYFNDMNDSYCIMPLVDHYVCMVDLLGRAGYLEEALNFIIKMPMKPDMTVWMCLLGSCRSHKDVRLGELVAALLFELDPTNTAPYDLLSNVYAEVGRWGDVQNLRRLMKDRGIRKIPGCSWIEVDKVVHAFFARDRSHPQTQAIYAKLEELSLEMKAAGYIPYSRHIPNDVEEEEKEIFLGYHSEKLAITFGLLNTSFETTVRVVKNLRVCVDCHTAIKFISKIVARDIVVRDANRFHHFKHGQCSCGDYW